MARYTDSLLVEGEHVLYRTRQHPIGRIAGARWGILAVVVADRAAARDHHRRTSAVPGRP